MPVQPDITVLVPVMNEAGNIRPLIDEISAVLAGRAHEIIYINDGSDDAGSAELAAALEEVPALRVLEHERRCGQSAALRSGLQIATAPLIAVLDGDGQNVPDDLLKLEAALLEAAPARGMAGGVRVGRKDGANRRWASILARWVRRSVLQDSHPDSGCGIKILHRDIFLSLPYFNHMHRFMPTLVAREGGIVLAVPVSHRARSMGQSKYGILDRLLAGMADLLGVIWLLRRTARPGKVVELTRRGH